MKPLIAVILLIAFAAQTFDKGLIILDYYIYPAAYAKDCVNKDKPMMHCCGRCQLRKKLQQQENNDKQNPDQRGDNKNASPLSSKSFFATVPLAKEQECTMNYPRSSFDKEIKMPRAVFHPPGA